jgi:dephospho-CoA kinase
MTETNKKIIIGLVGEISSGKGTAAAYLSEKYQAETLKFSTVLRDILKRLYLDISRQNLQTLSPLLREGFGQDVLARVINEDASHLQADLIVVDGIRRFADIAHLKNNPDFFLVSVDAPIETRYDRIIKRGENSDEKGKTFTEFLEDHKAETEVEIPALSHSAAYRLDNSLGLIELQKNIDGLLNELRKK